jgi:predicted MFS family arabinose efflux permease
MESSGSPEAKQPFISRSEWRLIFVLFAIQFTHTVDFVIMIPLGPQFTTSLGISPTQFNFLVGIYGFAAAIGSLLTATFLDRFDRKRCLLFLYAGFTISTLFCGLAPTYETLLVARSLAGLFGGVIGVAVLAIIGDVFADSRRGTATGAIMSAFGVASVAGVPLGLLLVELQGRAAPFIYLAGLSALIFLIAALRLPRMRGHIFQGPKHPSARFWETLLNPNHLRAYLFSIVLVMGSFTIVPQIANYMTKNVGRPEGDMKFFYLIAGFCTLFSMNVIGRLSDRLGKLFMFRLMASMSIVMCLVITNLPPTSLAMVLVVGTLFMVSTSGRFVPAQAMMVGASKPHVRGAFLGVNTCIQHIAMGLASVVGSLPLEEVDGKLTGYPIAGIFAAICGLIGLWVAGQLRTGDGVSVRRVQPPRETTPPAEPVLQG